MLFGYSGRVQFNSIILNHALRYFQLLIGEAAFNILFYFCQNFCDWNRAGKDISGLFVYVYFTSNFRSFRSSTMLLPFSFDQVLLPSVSSFLHAPIFARSDPLNVLLTVFRRVCGYLHECVHMAAPSTLPLTYPTHINLRASQQEQCKIYK